MKQINIFYPNGNIQSHILIDDDGSVSLIKRFNPDNTEILPINYYVMGFKLAQTIQIKKISNTQNMWQKILFAVDLKYCIEHDLMNFYNKYIDVDFERAERIYWIKK